MPELPDITVYIEALEKRIAGRRIQRVQIRSPFLLRTFKPPITSIEGKRVNELRRVGKRIAIGFEDDLWLVFHLMIAGRLHWHGPNDKAPGKQSLAVLEFENGRLSLTESGTKKRASLHLFEGERSLDQINPSGLEVMGCSLADFTKILTLRNHTLKRALTDPRLFSGIGNAYSDEILHAARLSPVKMTQKLQPAEIDQLHRAVAEVLSLWIDRLRAETGDGFPEHVTAFRPEMAVHGKFGKMCPVCGAKVQRIRYVSNETNYCPGCQTDGKLLADRSLSLLLKKDWPASAEELEELKPTGKVQQRPASTRDHE